MIARTTGDYIIIVCNSCFQSNKKEKVVVPAEAKNNGEPSEKPTLSSDRPQLQPQPPSSPTHSEARRISSKAERGVKRCLKNKLCDKASTDSVRAKGGAGDAPNIINGLKTTTKTGQEPSAKRTIAQLPETAKEDEGGPPSEKSAANEKAPLTHPTADRSPPTRASVDNRAETQGADQKPELDLAVGSIAQVRSAGRLAAILKTSASFN